LQIIYKSLSKKIIFFKKVLHYLFTFCYNIKSVNKKEGRKMKNGVRKANLISYAEAFLIVVLILLVF